MIRREHHKFYFKPGDVGTLNDEAYSYYLDEITLLNSDSINMGDGVVFGEHCWINAYGGVTFGDGAGIGPRSIIHSANHVIRDGVYVLDEWEPRPVVIGHRCWLGAGCIVLPGTRLGADCIAGAGSLLSGDYPAGSRIRNDKARPR